MALLLTDSTKTLKSGLLPLTDKLDDKNFHTWKYQAWLTIQTLSLERHLDPSQTPAKIETPSAAATLDPTKSASEAQPTESAAYKEWRQNDLALQTWLAASITKPYQNKILKCRSFHEAWTTIQLYVDATSRSRIQSLKSQMRGVKKTGTVEEYLNKLNSISESLASLDYKVSDDDYIQTLIDGLTEEYHGFTASVMGRFGSITVPEAEAFLIAFDEMLNRTKNSTQHLPVAHLTQQAYYSGDRGGGRRGRGTGRFQRGGRTSWQNTRTFCQICGRGGHGAYNCYFQFD
ncbi:hypothetical protein PIB30_117260 [Stylosanthes scabra]|uniref:CCHC-type domain-containing protein n=1 Tax=Stylosanthes scabra TaxID=79078 RepID=A0ABU6T5U3_9FABA|nr:hypothetical protein [Stylosanthes scabra]